MATKGTAGPGRAMGLAKVDAKMVVAVLACLALSAATYFLFTAPTRAQADAVRAQVGLAQQQLAGNDKRIADVNSGKASGAAQLLVQARALDKALPPDVDKVQMVGAIPGMAHQLGIVVNQMDPVAVATPTGAGNLKTQSFTMAASGSLDHLATWIGQLQGYPSTLTVSGLTITVGSGDQSTANFTLKAYYVPSAALTAAH